MAIAYDPWNATHIALRLQEEGAKMVEFRQGLPLHGRAHVRARES
jgi:phage terminase large subunit-like protein